MSITMMGNGQFTVCFEEMKRSAPDIVGFLQVQGVAEL